MKKDKIDKDKLNPIDAIRLEYRQGKLTVKGRDYATQQKPALNKFTLDEIVTGTEDLSKNKKST